MSAGHAAIEAAFAAALVDPSKPVPVGLLSPRGTADPVRFAVYRNNVHVGLVEALARRFPVVGHLVGDEFFRGMARVYVGARRPASPLMFAYGDDFPDHVAAFPPAASLPYLADVARIEVAWSNAYNAADAPALDVPRLGAIPLDDLLERRLPRHPAATLVRSDHPVGSIWQGHQRHPVVPPAAWTAEAVLVTRPAFDVLVTVLPPQDAEFAADLVGGAGLGDAAERALSADPAFNLGRALVGLVSCGAFTPI